MSVPSDEKKNIDGNDLCVELVRGDAAACSFEEVIRISIPHVRNFM